VSIGKTLFDDAFEDELLFTVEDFPDTKRWSAARRNKLKNNPAGEDGVWWRANGPGMVDNWIKWRAQSGWRVWTTPDGQPAIELSQEFKTPSGRDIKGYIDRIMIEAETKELVIVDLKSGARSPESDLQLGFYRYEMWNTYGVDIRKGAYWMARTGEMLVHNIQRLLPALFNLWMKRFDDAITHGIFLPNVTFRCRACSHSDFCTAYGGAHQHLDPDYATLEDTRV
jgi:hypothetical protein